MKRLNKILLTGILAVIFVLASSFAWSLPYLVEEPLLTKGMSWDLTANGMLYFEFDRDNDGKGDFYTLRVVERSFFSAETPTEVRRDFPMKLVIFSQYTADRYYYIVDPKPLFYAIDLNEDGVWDLIYKDVAADGVNGNEGFYASPSGMFTPRIEGF